MSTLPTPRDDADRKLLADVADPGWHVVMVPEEDGTPGWCFTVGLHHNHDHPELVVFGLPLGTAHALLNVAGEAIKAGQRFEPDTPCPGLIRGFDCVFRPVAARWHEPFLGYARWFYRGDAFAALQLFWPNRHGALPWTDAADDRLRASQPLLWETTVEEAGVASLLASMEDGS